MVMDEKRRHFWRYLTESYGAFLTFKDPSQQDRADRYPDAETIWLVGTLNCSTCVGFYIKLDDTHYFIAHINASNARLWTQHGNTQPWLTRTGTAEDEQRMYNTVLTTLRTKFAEKGWTLTGQERVVICCPWPEHGGQVYSGTHVIRVIKDFLGNGGRNLTEENLSGFIVDQRTGEVLEKFARNKTFGADVGAPELPRYVRRWETVIEPWWINV